MNSLLRTLVVCLALTVLFPITHLSAQVSVWDGSWEPWTHGTGTEGDPFLIENAQQLAYLAYFASNGNNNNQSLEYYHYKLMVDVNLNGNESLQWIPIGGYYYDNKSNTFTGHFDGNNHSISGLYYHGYDEYVGLFGHINNSIIENLISVEGTIITGGRHAGGIVGRAFGTTIINNCTNNCSVEITYNDYSNNLILYAGGIIGYSHQEININNCRNQGTISVKTENFRNSTIYAAGIIGMGNGLTNVKNCDNYGVVTSEIFELKSVNSGNDYCYSGGVIGCGGNTINCCNYGDITARTILGSQICSYSGGISGKNTIIEKCFNGGKITSYSSTGQTGGAVSYSGGIIGSDGSVNNSYNAGGVSSLCESDAYAGGIVGFSSTINNCYNVGNVSAESGFYNAYAGGITGKAGTIFNSYYLNTCGGNNTFGGTPMSSDEMQSEELVDLLNAGSCKTFVHDVTPNINDGYPLLTMMADCASTGLASDITDVSTKVYGFVDADHISFSKGFEYRKVGESTFTTVNVVDGNSYYSCELNGLESNNTYEYRAFAYFPDCDYTAYGETRTFEISWLNMDSIYVYNADMLRWVAEQCNDGVTFQGKCVILMNDIVLPENMPNNMISIGSYPDHPFKGTFDGNGKLIYNLYIDQPNTPYQGFFGYTLDANLYNVGLVNITASGRNYTGGMVAYAENTHMRDCYVNGGTLYALSYCGGLVGYQEQGTNSIISGCYNTCTVSGNHYVGGLVGFSNYGTVRNSYVAAPVSGQGNAIGAIIGGANEVLMYNCYFSTEITGQTNAIGENNFKDGEGLTNAQMRDPKFVNTLNQGLVTPVWKSDFISQINNGFPILIWQGSGNDIEEHTANGKDSSVSIFPNPSNGEFTIQCEGMRQIEVYSIDGKLLKNIHTESPVRQLNGLPNGTFLMKIITDDQVIVSKIVKL